VNAAIPSAQTSSERGVVAGRVVRTRAVFDRPIFVLTADVDWASDYCIDRLASFANDRGITPTFFVTHASRAIDALRAGRRAELGIHPNFRAGSSHGETRAEVIDHVMAIVPDPIAVRSHCYLEDSEAASILSERGVRIDSNVCLFLQAGLGPLHHWSGAVRLPCFWEDDVHWERGFAWTFERLREAFLTPGLKIINVHPFMFALNIPDAAAYARHKRLIPTLDAEMADALRFRGPGPASFLAEMIDTVRAEGLAFTTMGDLVTELDIAWVEP
jgi:hypothetical protein